MFFIVSGVTFTVYIPPFLPFFNCQSVFCLEVRISIQYFFKVASRNGSELADCDFTVIQNLWLFVGK